MQIAAEEILAICGFKSEDCPTAEQICSALLQVPEEKLVELGLLVVAEPTLSPYLHMDSSSRDYIPSSAVWYRTSVELRQLIKREHNPMARIALQRELSLSTAFNSKHNNKKKRR